MKRFTKTTVAWWLHQVETFSALLALYAGNSPATGDFPSQRPVTPQSLATDMRRLFRHRIKRALYIGIKRLWVTRSFDVLFDLLLDKGAIWPSLSPCTVINPILLNYFLLDKRLSKQSWGWWFETPSCPLWRHSNGKFLWWALRVCATYQCPYLFCD